MVNKGHDSVTLDGLSIVRAVPGRVEGVLTIQQHNVNRLQTLHGGLICTLTDTMGSLAVASKGLYSTGVSTDIHTTFVKPAGKVGDEVKVTGEIVSLGKLLATARIELRHPTTDALLSYGSHTKFVGKAHGHEENVEFSEDGDSVVKGKKEGEWADS
ncbi:hypothetical protein OC834_003479 [Tilletia horrida]|nr:hypothetical protein OC834_003479 [Tilletia horrida]KAK0558565.1 hypothetical protein OC844_005054 [Tilletia horrida]